MPSASPVWFVYLLHCADGSLYTGITTDLARRLEEHNSDDKRGARYTRGRRPVSLAYAEATGDRSSAARREAAIRRLSRRQKLALAAAHPARGDKTHWPGGTIPPIPDHEGADVTPALLDAFRRLADGLAGIDTAAYAAFGKDPREPVIGLGEPDVRVGFFGRDPGRDEVQHGMPFIGAGGQKVRAACHAHLFGEPMPDFAASVAVGRHFFWANTVPYKPLGNKAWSMAVKKRFQPLVAELLLRTWEGADLITLGREAFLWFGIHQPREVRAALEAFWTRPDRFERYIEVPLALPDGPSRHFRLHPLPHPSPLNATWYKRFPGLLTERLVQLGVQPDTVRQSVPAGVA